MTDHPVPSEAASLVVYDAATVDDLRDLFGPARFAQMLAGLDEEIAQRLEGASASDPSLRDNAHVVVSVSGTLGFTPLSNACAALERACLADTDVSEPLRIVRAAASAARRAIAALRADTV